MKTCMVATQHACMHIMSYIGAALYDNDNSIFNPLNFSKSARARLMQLIIYKLALAYNIIGFTYAVHDMHEDTCT